VRTNAVTVNDVLDGHKLLEIDCVDRVYLTYVLTPEGQRIAIFYTKLYNRLLRPLGAADQPQAPPGLRQALAVIDHHVDDYIVRARLKPAA
jgi:hypothetical protein